MLIGPWTHRRIRVVIEMTTIMMLLLIEVLKAFCLQNSAEIPCCCLIDKCIDIQQFQVTKAHWWQFVLDEVIDSRCVQMCLCFGHVTNLIVDVHKENYFFFQLISLIDFQRLFQEMTMRMRPAPLSIYPAPLDWGLSVCLWESPTTALWRSCDGNLEIGFFHFWERNISGIFGHG